MSHLVFFYIPCPDHECASQIAQKAVEEKLAGCGNCSQIESIYEWQGKIQQEAETLLILKTTKEKSKALEAFIEKCHPYEVSCIAKIQDIEVNTDYFNWIRTQLS